jgi:hypothetical protein
MVINEYVADSGTKTGNGKNEVFGELWKFSFFPPQILHDFGSNPGRCGRKPETKSSVT